MSTSHLNALEIRLSHERDHLAKAKDENEKALRRVWIAQIEKEIADEKKFLGIESESQSEISDEELLAALLS